MCLLGLVYKQHPDCPIFLMANREEAYARPTASPAIRQSPGDALEWLGGLDLTAGGTWLGINRRGLIVAVTNRPKQRLPPDLESRGILCRELLSCPDAQAAYSAAKERLARDVYAGLNLLLADDKSGFILQSGDERIDVPLAPGITLIANGPLNDPRDPRITYVGHVLEREIAKDWQSWVPLGKTLCGTQEAAETPAICLHRRQGGTVSSTIIALTADAANAEYWYAPGPPCRTPYTDVSPRLRKVIS
jgi:uncharacterized protein with NRDE domain